MRMRSTGHALALPGFVLFAWVAAAPLQAQTSALPKIHSAMRNSTSLFTQRLLDEVTREHEEPTPQRLGDPLGDARQCDLVWRDTLLHAFERADLTRPTRTAGQACTCYAEIRVIFRSQSGRAEMRLCYLCGEVGVVLGISRADRFAQAGTFGDGAPGFVRFVRTHYADDERLMEIVDRAYPGVRR